MALDQMRPSIAVEEAIAGARTQRQSMARRRAAWRWLPPIAAAAVLAGLLVLRPFDSTRVPDWDGVAQPAPRIEPLVDAPDAGSIMVFETGDASVKVIWFY